jgi:hypothetical protein
MSTACFFYPIAVHTCQGGAAMAGLSSSGVSGPPRGPGMPSAGSLSGPATPAFSSEDFPSLHRAGYVWLHPVLVVPLALCIEHRRPRACVTGGGVDLCVLFAGCSPPHTHTHHHHHPVRSLPPHTGPQSVEEIQTHPLPALLPLLHPLHRLRVAAAQPGPPALHQALAGQAAPPPWVLARSLASWAC